MLLDSSGLLAYIDEDDSAHDNAVAFFTSADVLLTHGYILAELIPLFQKRGIPRADSLAFHARLLASKDIEIVWVDKELHDSAFVLLNDRMDKTYSLCDAVSFLLMRSRGITEALTTDHPFEQEGFIRLLKA
jgi:predicted nucleic acid-binding protein